MRRFHRHLNIQNPIIFDSLATVLASGDGCLIIFLATLNYCCEKQNFSCNSILHIIFLTTVNYCCKKWNFSCNSILLFLEYIIFLATVNYCCEKWNFSCNSITFYLSCNCKLLLRELELFLQQYFSVARTYYISHNIKLPL